MEMSNDTYGIHHYYVDRGTTMYMIMNLMMLIRFMFNMFN